MGGDIEITNDIMITQYYSQDNTDNNWIEIKNISGGVIASGTYYLVLYDENDIANIETVAPTANELIPEMAID